MSFVNPPPKDEVPKPKPQKQQSSSTINSVAPLVSKDGNSSPNAWEDEDDFDDIKEVEERDSQENWSLGRLEEYKVLMSSVRWMIFDICFNGQDVFFKCVGRIFKTFFSP